MVSLRLTSFIFALMFILLDIAVCTHQEMAKIVVAAENGMVMAKGKPLTAPQDNVYAVHTPKGKFGARKMKRMFFEKDQGKSTSQGESSKITGMDIESMKKLEDTFKPAASRVEKQKMMVEGEDTTEQLMNLMNKDYRLPSAPHKPPVSYHESFGGADMINP